MSSHVSKVILHTVSSHVSKVIKDNLLCDVQLAPACPGEMETELKHSWISDKPQKQDTVKVSWTTLS